MSSFPKTERYLMARESEILSFIPQAMRDKRETGLDQTGAVLDCLAEVRACMDEIRG